MLTPFHDSQSTVSPDFTPAEVAAPRSPERDGRRLVVALMYGLVREGGPTYWDQASALLDWGFAQDRAAGIGVL